MRALSKLLLFATMLFIIKISSGQVIKLNISATISVGTEVSYSIKPFSKLGSVKIFGGHIAYTVDYADVAVVEWTEPGLGVIGIFEYGIPTSIVYETVNEGVTVKFDYDYDNAGNLNHRYLLEPLNTLKSGKIQAENTQEFIKESESENSFSNNSNSENIVIYPNPAYDYFNIQITDQDTPVGNYTLYTILGKKVLSGTIDSFITLVNINHLSVGNYVLNIQTGGVAENIQIMKTN